MGIGPHNPWWLDVLENGPSSRYAPYFDVDWAPIKRELAAKVLVPVLGDQFGEVLERGELQLAREGGAFFVRYWDHSLSGDAAAGAAPARPSPRRAARRARHERRPPAGAGEHPRRRSTSWRRARRSRPTPSPSARAKKRSPSGAWPRSSRPARRIAAFADENVRIVQRHAGRPRTASTCSSELLDASGLSPRPLARRRRGDQLPPLLRHQLARRHPHGGRARLRRHAPARLPAARRGQDHRPAHRPSRRAVRAVGLLPPPAAGARGALRRRREDPRRRTSRCRRRGRSTAPPATSGSTRSTACSSTGAHAAAFSELYARFTGRRHIVARRSSTRRSACSCARRWRREINMLVASPQPALARATGARATSRSTRSPARSIDYVARLPIYRTYVEGNDAASIDAARPRQYIESTIRGAKRASRELNRTIYDFLRSVLLLEDPTDESREFVRKLQQVTGPVTAKAIEDTAFYLYNRLVSLNEVGGDPQRFGVSVEEFHRDNAARLRRLARLAQHHRHARHQARRGRAPAHRRAVEIPTEWEQRLQRWARAGRALQERATTASVAPDANDELLVYQTLVGSFPDDGRVSDEYRDARRRLPRQGAQGGQGRTRRGPTPTRPTRRRRATSPTRCCRRSRSSPTSRRSSRRVAAAARRLVAGAGGAEGRVAGRARRLPGLRAVGSVARRSRQSPAGRLRAAADDARRASRGGWPKATRRGCSWRASWAAERARRRARQAARWCARRCACAARTARCFSRASIVPLAVEGPDAGARRRLRAASRQRARSCASCRGWCCRCTIAARPACVGASRRACRCPRACAARSSTSSPAARSRRRFAGGWRALRRLPGRAPRRLMSAEQAARGLVPVVDCARDGVASKDAPARRLASGARALNHVHARSRRRRTPALVPRLSQRRRRRAARSRR